MARATARQSPRERRDRFRHQSPPLFTWVVITVLFVVLAGGCICCSNPLSAGKGSGNGASSSAFDKQYDFGTIKSSAIGKNGTAEKQTLTYQREEVAKNLFLDRKIEYDRKEGGLSEGVITIHFENKGASGSYRHVEKIPKEFAQNVKDLKFSIQPTKVIKADPEVEWDVKGKSADIRISSADKKPSGNVTYYLETYAIKRGLEKCDGLETEDETMACTLNLVRTYRNTIKQMDDFRHMNLMEPRGALIWSVINGNYKYCNLLNDEDAEYCKEYAFRTLLRDCDGLSGDANSDCIRKTMWDLRDIDAMRRVCDFIRDEKMRQECNGEASTAVCKGITDKLMRDRCVLNIARTKGDTKFCDEVADADLKDDCIFFIAKDKNKQSLCERMSDDDKKDQCYMQMIMQNNDLSICDKIKDAERKGGCITIYSFRTHNTDDSICDGITDSSSKSMCILIAVSNQIAAGHVVDDAVCEKIPEDDWKAICKAFGAKDASVCEKIEDDTYRDLCYVILAVKSGDKSFCARINDTELMKICAEMNETGLQEKTTTTTTAEEVGLPGGSSCPVNPPKGSKKVEPTENNNYAEYYLTPNNKYVGEFIQWAGKGKAKKTSVFCYNAEGQKHGPYTIWDPDGSKREEGTYKNDRFDGVVRRWYRGHLNEEQTYKDGVLDGKSTSWLDGTDTVSSRKSYRNGKEDGLQETFYMDGKPRMTSEYLAGEWTGKSTEYREDGKIGTKYDGVEKNGKFTGKYYTAGYSGPPTECDMVDDKMSNCRYVASLN